MAKFESDMTSFFDAPRHFQDKGKDGVGDSRTEVPDAGG